jgi:CDP-paratose 2-epimerase
MRMLITGGAGFIGCHATDHFGTDHRVTVLDNLSRDGARNNLEWLRKRRDFSFLQQDIRDGYALTDAVRRVRPEIVIHLASQVAVTTSVRDPRHDFEVNAVGTFNVLEAVRQEAPEALVIYSSTNKVYGGMEDVGIVLDDRRYRYDSLPHGVAEDRPLDFHSPYGCSKGAGDQYVRDYARIFGLRTVVFRQSCIYGTRQFGVEDQGWIAWFAIRAVLGCPLTIFGDGCQARDVLWVEDLLDAYRIAMNRPDQMTGRVYNLGGGPSNQLSLLESIQLLEGHLGRPISVTFAPPRPGDQRVFVADTRLAERELGWRARTAPAEGIKRLVRWVQDHEALFRT